MRIEKEVVEEEIDTEEDLIIAVDTVTFKQNVKCKNIVSVGYKRNINAGNINAWNINAGDINVWNINAGDINVWNINAGDINVWNINAWDINARNINADFIVCETRKKKIKSSKTVCRNIITKRSTIEKKQRGE